MNNRLEILRQKHGQYQVAARLFRQGKSANMKLVLATIGGSTFYYSEFIVTMAGPRLSFEPRFGSEELAERELLETTRALYNIVKAKFPLTGEPEKIPFNEDAGEEPRQGFQCDLSPADLPRVFSFLAKAEQTGRNAIWPRFNQPARGIDKDPHDKASSFRAAWDERRVTEQIQKGLGQNLLVIKHALATIKPGASGGQTAKSMTSLVGELVRQGGYGEEINRDLLDLQRKIQALFMSGMPASKRRNALDDANKLVELIAKKNGIKLNELRLASLRKARQTSHDLVDEKIEMSRPGERDPNRDKRNIFPPEPPTVEEQEATKKLVNRRMKAKVALTVCFDFDGVIALEPTPYEAEQTPNFIGLPVHEIIKLMEKLSAQPQVKIVICSARFNPKLYGKDQSDKAKEAKDTVKKWLADNNVIYDELTAFKPPADLYVDDRAFAFEVEYAARCALELEMKLKSMLDEIRRRH